MTFAGRAQRWLVATVWLLPCVVDATELPYCRFTPATDGDPGEWRQPWLEQHILETEGAPAQRNRVSVRACWTLGAVHVSIDVDDAELIQAPPGLDVDRYHQYDSLQIYLDPLADSGPRMNDDDVDLLLLPDGRWGVLRGDALIADIAGVAVPQRVAAPLPLSYASRLVAGGWQLELQLPWSGLGVDANPGRRIAVDVASNDWLVDHAPGRSEALTPERIRALADRPSEPPVPDPVIAVQVLPLNWSGERDFGYPSRWRVLTLSGGPDWAQRLALKVSKPALLAMALTGLLLGVMGSVGVHLWHRQRLRELLARLESMTPTADPAPADSTLDSIQSDLPDPRRGTEPDRADGPQRDRKFAEAVLAYVRDRLDQPLPPGEIAGHFHVSLRTLQRRLQSGMNTSLQDLLLAARLDTARSLLQSGELRVGQVAARVGFADLSHFSRRYRQAYGESPSATAGAHVSAR